MVWTYSHAILDSVFADVLRDVFDVYDALVRGEPTPEPPPRPGYERHIAWLDGHLAATARPPPATSARSSPASRRRPTWRPRASRRTARPRARPTSVTASPSIARRATRYALSETHGLRRPVAFVEAAWALTLSAFSGQDDVVFGSTRACRRSSVEAPTRCSVSSSTPCPCAQVRRRSPSSSSSGSSARSPWSSARTAHAARRGHRVLGAAPGAPLFDTIVVFNEQAHAARFGAFGPAWSARHVDSFHQTNFALTLLAYDGPEIAFTFSYDPSKFAAENVDRVASLFRANLTSMAERLAASPEATLEALPGSEADVQRLLAQTSGEALALDGPMTVHEAFEAQVDRTPDATAVIFRGASLRTGSSIGAPTRWRKSSRGAASDPTGWSACSSSARSDGRRAPRHPQVRRGVRPDGRRTRASASRGCSDTRADGGRHDGRAPRVAPRAAPPSCASTRRGPRTSARDRAPRARASPTSSSPPAPPGARRA